MVYAIFVLAGAALAALVLFGLDRFWAERKKDALSIVLAFMAAAYIGPSLGSWAPVDIAEITISISLGILAIFCLRGPWILLVIGYVIHGAWDALHGFVVPVHLPDWYAPLCIGFDWTAAAIMLRWHQSEQGRAG